MSTLDRRTLLRLGAAGLAPLALPGAREDRAGEPLAPREPHFAPRAKRVIWLHMAGSPSQIDLFDPKPKLADLDRKPCPEELLEGERFAFIKGVPKILASPYSFERHGESGQWVSELLPHTASIVDELAIVRSMHSTQFNHAPAQQFLNTGHERIGRPSMGAWTTWALGTENPDLPGFVVLQSGRFGPSGGNSLWSSGFLPTVHQGVRFHTTGDPVPFLANPPGLRSVSRRRCLDVVRALDALHLERCKDPEVETRMAQYELAWRMQASVPELVDLESEPESVLADYGVEPGMASFASNCLLARRLVERDVRFVQLYHWGWDSHGTGPGDDIVTSLPERCRETDRACAALVRDLKQRGLLEDTLVVWGGEFGRTPMNEERDGSKFLGRDHHPHAFTMWMAGGGIRPGAAHGATDELGYYVVEDPVSVHDLHATMLHCLGLDHERLTFRSQGRDFRLTDVAGEVLAPLLA